MMIICRSLDPQNYFQGQIDSRFHDTNSIIKNLIGIHSTEPFLARVYVIWTYTCVIIINKYKWACMHNTVIKEDDRRNYWSRECKHKVHTGSQDRAGSGTSGLSLHVPWNVYDSLRRQRTSAIHTHLPPTEMMEVWRLQALLPQCSGEGKVNLVAEVEELTPANRTTGSEGMEVQTPCSLFKTLFQLGISPVWDQHRRN